MRIVLFTGNHPRHVHMAAAVARSGMLTGLIIEKRAAHIPVPPPGLAPVTRSLFTLHFELRAEAEHRFLTDGASPVDALCERVLQVDRESLNASVVHDFLRDVKPDLIISYGVHKLSPHTLSLVRGAAWNIHGGLSPWYRGAITHFWPSYMLEPQMTGMTLHETTQTLDAGAIIHQSAVVLTRGDGVHDVASRSVAEFADELPGLLDAFARSGLETIESRPQGTLGKLWRASDWRPEHLHVIYGLYRDRVVDFVLDRGEVRAAPIFRNPIIESRRRDGRTSPT